MVRFFFFLNLSLINLAFVTRFPIEAPTNLTSVCVMSGNRQKRSIQKINALIFMYFACKEHKDVNE